MHLGANNDPPWSLWKLVGTSTTFRLYLTAFITLGHQHLFGKLLVHMPGAIVFEVAARGLVPSSSGHFSQQVLNSWFLRTIANKEAVFKWCKSSGKDPGSDSPHPPPWLYTLSLCRGSRQKHSPLSFSFKDAKLHTVPAAVWASGF